MNILQTIGLKKYYRSGSNITRALDGVTLLNMIGGLDIATSGSVIVRGDELAEKNDEVPSNNRERRDLIKEVVDYDMAF